MSQRRPLGDILKGMGRLTDDDVERALEHQREHGGYFGEALVSLGFVKKEEVEWSLASQFDLPYVFPQADAVDPAAAALVTADWAIRNRALPITRVGDRVTVLVDSPLSDPIIEELERRTGLTVELALAPGSAIRGVAREVFSTLRQAREGLTTTEAVSLSELRRLARDSGAEHWGISVREDRALGWYDHGTAVRRYRLGAGWARELESIVSPPPSERLPGLGEAAWVARLEQEPEPALVEVRALATPEGRELLFTPREPLADQDPLPPLPRALLDEVRLVLEKGGGVLVLRCRPPALGRELLPRLPDLLLPAGHRALHLATGGESVRIPGVLVLPLEGPEQAVARRLEELQEFRFDVVTAVLSPSLGTLVPGVAEMAPTVFLLLDPEQTEDEGDEGAPAREAAGGLDARGLAAGLPPDSGWILDLQWQEADGEWSWSLTAGEG